MLYLQLQEKSINCTAGRPEVFMNASHTHTELRRVSKISAWNFMVKFLSLKSDSRLVITHASARKLGWEIRIHYLNVNCNHTDFKKVDWISRSSTQIKVGKSSCNLIKKQRRQLWMKLCLTTRRSLNFTALWCKEFPSKQLYIYKLPAGAHSRPSRRFYWSPHIASTAVRISESAFTAEK